MTTTRRSTAVYPFLFAIIPVLRLVAAYPGWAHLSDAAAIVATVLAASAAVYGLVFLATRRHGGRLPALVTLAVVLGFWVYPRAATLLERQTSLSHSVLLPLWTAATGGTIWWLVGRPARLDRVEQFLTLTSAMLVGWFVLSIGVAEWRSAWAVRHSTLVRRLAVPIPVQPGARVGPKRDIYLIALDEYANAEVTRRLFGFDNHVFLDSLQRLGFVVPTVHSNYLHTFLSLPSLLNAAHVADLEEELGSESVDRTLPDHLLAHNRTVPFLKSQGYRFVFFPSLSWEATRHHPQADVEFHPWREFDPVRELHGSGLRQVLKRTSLLRYGDWEMPRIVRAHVTRTLSEIADVPSIPGPVFAFAHVLSPHGPYVFDRNCRPPIRRIGGPTHAAAAYVEQVQCLNDMVLDLVTTLLRKSEIPPVILLQSDHGSKMLRFYKAETAEQMPVPAAKERVGAFGAYYLPDHGARAFGDSVTVVNVLGHVLRVYLGARLPRQPDAMYLSVDAAPYAFERVDFGWLAREDWSRRRGTEPPAAARTR